MRSLIALFLHVKALECDLMADFIRKPNRLPGFDYSSQGAYFITICTERRRCVLSTVVAEGLAPPHLNLSRYGQIAEAQIQQLSSRFPCVVVDRYVIMPNHIHLLLLLHTNGGASPSATVSDVLRVFKSLTTRLCDCGGRLFQRSFHDHIVRDEQDYLRIAEYIDTNPAKWTLDCFFVD